MCAEMRGHVKHPGIVSMAVDDGEWTDRAPRYLEPGSGTLTWSITVGEQEFLLGMRHYEIRTRVLRRKHGRSS